MLGFTRSLVLLVLVAMVATGCAGVTKIGNIPTEPGFYTVGEVNAARPSSSVTIMVDADGKVVPLVAGQQPGWLPGTANTGIAGGAFYFGMKEMNVPKPSKTEVTQTGGGATASPKSCSGTGCTNN